MREQSDTNEISSLLRQFWEIEKPSTSHDRPVLNPDEHCALEQVEKSLKYLDGRYQVALPWKENATDLPDNYDMALETFTEESRDRSCLLRKHHSIFGEGLHSQDRPNRRKTRKEMVPATLSRCKTGESHKKDSHRI